MGLRETYLANHIARWVQGHDTLLDVGGGNGRLALAIARATGVSPTITEVSPHLKVDLPFVTQQDPFRLPVADQSFDAVLLGFVLHHIASFDDQLRLFAEVTRVARRRIIVLEDTPGSRFERWLTMAWDWSLNVLDGVPTPFTYRTVAEWEKQIAIPPFRLTASAPFRGLWPTLATYSQCVFVLDRRDP